MQPLAKKACCSPPPTGGLDFFLLGRIPTLARAWQAGGFYAGQVARPGFYAGQECGALGIEAVGRAIGRARTHWASHQTRLGKPSNEVGRARTHWANHSTTFTVANACACLALCLLGTTTSACSARLLKCLLGTVPAWHVYLSACSALCLLGTST